MDWREPSESCRSSHSRRREHRGRRTATSLACLATTCLCVLTTTAAAQRLTTDDERRLVTPGGRRVVDPGGQLTVDAFALESVDAGPAVKGAPYSAEATTEIIQTFLDGNRIVRRTTASLYRDSRGRTRREVRLDSRG